MSALAAKQSQYGPKNNIGTPGIGAGSVNTGTPNSPDRLALEQQNGLNAIASKQAMSELDTNGPSLAGNNKYSETNKYAQ